MVADDLGTGTGNPDPAPKADEGAKPQPDPTKPSPNPAPAPVDNSGGWEKEKRAFIADIQKERKARQQAEQAIATHRAELELERKRVQALSGVSPKSPHDQEAEEVRERFAQLYPELAGLTKEDIEALRELRGRSTELQETTRHYWTTHAQTIFTALEKEVASELGGDKLTDRQSKALRRAYALECQENPEFLKRHESGDPELVKEFAKEWAEDWLKPALRKQAANDVDRARRVPSGRDRTISTPAGKKIDYSDPKAVEDLLVAGFKERGGQFGR